jgi:hypothetical protein
MKKPGFVLTDWNMNTKEYYTEMLDKENIRYIAWGEEVCPNTGRRHNQAFLYFHSGRSTSKSNLNKMGDWWGPKHCYIESIRGSFLSNETYCSKEKHYHEVGDKPNPGERSDIKENIQMILTGKMTPDDLLLCDPVSYNFYKNTYQRAHDIYMRKQFRTNHTSGLWIWGKSGRGKSHEAYENFDPETHYDKVVEDDWWDNYKQQDTVILNEFRGEISYQFLMKLTDKWPISVKRRNKAPIPFISKKIIITSPEHPKIYYRKVLSEGNNWEQLQDRFEIREKIGKNHRHKNVEEKCSPGNIETGEESETVYIIKKKKIKIEQELDFEIPETLEEELMRKIPSSSINMKKFP